jgi:hypothetical protein
MSREIFERLLRIRCSSMRQGTVAGASAMMAPFFHGARSVRYVVGVDSGWSWSAIGEACVQRLLQQQGIDADNTEQQEQARRSYRLEWPKLEGDLALTGSRMLQPEEVLLQPRATRPRPLCTSALPSCIRSV